MALVLSSVLEEMPRQTTTNLCHHSNDFKMEAEWHFFATSHGKSTCDGIGGTKILAVRASLQSATDNQILTPKHLFHWAQNHISGIQYSWLSSVDIQNHNAKFELEKRYALGETILGTQSHHSFVPRSCQSLEMRRLSDDSLFTFIDVAVDQLQRESYPNVGQ